MKRMALYPGFGVISRKWRYIKEVTPYEGDGIIPRSWRHIKEVALHQRGDAI
jgi:hypothetical protein